MASRDNGVGDDATAAVSSVPLAWHIGAKVVTEGVVAALALLTAAVTGDVALVAFATPLALAAVLGLTRARPAPPVIELSVTPLVSGPGEPIEVSLTVSSTTTSVCHLALSLPPGLGSEGDARWTVLLWRARPHVLTCTLRAARAGRFAVGNVLVRVTDGSSALIGEGKGADLVTIESRPVPLALRALVRPERVRATAGDRVARLAGDGIEFAEVREESVGALERRINWRATARHGTTCINVHHPERSTDVVLLVDTFSEALLPAVVAIAASLADTYVRHHDRLGLVAFGGILDWVEPGTGPSHLERIRRSLLSSEAYFSYAWKTAEVIPRRLFPAGCLVLAVSPLGDSRFTSTLASLRSRGIDLAVVEVEPSWPEETLTGLAGSLARRIVSLERTEIRRRFWHLGVPVATLEGPDGLAGALAEIAAFRRSLRGRAGAGARLGGPR
ncbi:MAG TPA: DUF58 domain-containing protein [Acidimicrobiales bacterium]|nr:DUF58 domain-containing protein [Acidimicrobiales bacterium]